MARYGEQHVGETAGDMRADRLALERRREAADRRAQDRDGEVIAPEIDEPLEKRRLADDGGAEPGADLGEIDRPDALVERALGGVVAAALVAAHLELGHDHAGRIRQAARQRRRRPAEL